MKKFGDITLNIKIIAYLLLFIILTFLGYLIAVNAISKQVVINKDIANINTKLSQIGQLKNNTLRLYSEVKQHILFDDPESMLLSENRISALYQDIDLLIANTKQNLSSDESLLLNEYFFQYETFRKSLQEIITLSGVSDSLAIHLLDNSAFVQYIKIESIFINMDTQLRQQFEKRNIEIAEAEQSSLFRSLLLMLLGILLTAGGGVYFIYDLVIPLKRLRTHINQLAEGRFIQEEISEKSDLIGTMVSDLNKIRFNQFLLTEFAKELKEGNYDAIYTTKGESDEIGKILINLRDNLKKTKSDQQNQFIENEQRNWIERGISNFNEILRLYSNDIKELGHQIISATVQYLNAVQGGIFILHDEKADDVHLDLAASYAYNRRKFLQKRIDIGDGLIGLSVLEKETLHLTELPEEYLEITSGLGDAKPVSILIVPLLKEDTVHGVIEISSFLPFETYQIQFVERLGSTIASTLLSVKINERTNRLLAESQKQSEELASQEEEMRQNLEELRAIQEEAEKQIIEFKSSIDAIDPFLLKLELNMEGQIIRSNPTFLNFVSSPEEKLLGKQVSAYFPTNLSELIDEHISNAAEGHSANFELEMDHRSGHIMLYCRLTPIYNNFNQVYKLIWLGFVCSTSSETNQSELEVKPEALSATIDDITYQAWQTSDAVWTLQMQEYEILVQKLNDKEKELRHLQSMISSKNTEHSNTQDESDPDYLKWKDGLTNENIQ